MGWKKEDYNKLIKETWDEIDFSMNRLNRKPKTVLVSSKAMDYNELVKSENKELKDDTITNSVTTSSNSNNNK